MSGPTSLAYDDYALGFTLLFVKAGKGVFLDQQHCRNNQPEAAVPLAKIEKVTLSTDLI